MEPEVQGGELIDARGAIEGIRTAQAVVNSVMRQLPAEIGARLAAEFKVNPKPAIEMATREIEAVLSRLAERCDDLVDSIDPDKVRARRHATRVVLGALAHGLRVPPADK
jgi:hypothetical protein